jgi:thiamine biosynthesis lipoprotein
MVWNTIRQYVLALCIACPVLAAAERVEALEPHMGTMFRIVLYADDAARAHSAIRAAFDRVAELDDKLSDYKPDSELNGAAAAVDHEVKISRDLYTVLSASQSLAERTNGAFDVTLGPLIRLWRTARQTRRLPSQAEISAALDRTGYTRLHLKNEGDQPTLRLDVAGMQLDLGAIAKGYAADEGLRVLRQYGIPQALVAASGDIAFGDPPPGKAGWDTSAETGGPFAAELQLHNAAISTSGDTEQFVEIDGARYSHIVNPATGKGLTTRIGVTVIAKKGIDSDGLSTAASVVAEQSGPEAALKLLENAGARGIVVFEIDGRWKKFESPNWQIWADKATPALRYPDASPSSDIRQPQGSSVHFP